MTKRQDMTEWVIDAIRSNNGSATIVDICKHVWKSHEKDLRRSGDGFYTWQYDIRWAGQKLRDDGALKPASECPKGVWMLS